MDIVKLMFESQPHEKEKCLGIKDAQNMTPLVSLTFAIIDFHTYTLLIGIAPCCDVQSPRIG